MENSSNNTIDLRRLFNLCRKHLKFLITCTIVLALAGFIVSKFIMTPKYTATTQLLVNQKKRKQCQWSGLHQPTGRYSGHQYLQGHYYQSSDLKGNQKRTGQPSQGHSQGPASQVQDAGRWDQAIGQRGQTSEGRTHRSRLQYDDQPAVRRDHDQDADQLAGFLRQRGNR